MPSCTTPAEPISYSIAIHCHVALTLVEAIASISRFDLAITRSYRKLIVAAFYC